MTTRRDSKRMDNRGSLLLITLFLMVVLLTLGSAFAVMTVNEAKFVEKQRRQAQAFALAEAGIDRAAYDLRLDFVNDLSSPSWADGDINGMAIGPDTVAFYTLPYAGTSIGAGSYTVQVKNIVGNSEGIWVQSTGTVGGVSQKIQIYARIMNTSPWNNAIFAGRGSAAAHNMINGNVNINGSVHILGSGLTSSDAAVQLGGTAELVGNNYQGLSAALRAKVPVLPTVDVNGETVETLSAALRVKRGRVDLSGNSTVGQTNVAGNTTKEKVDGVYVTDGFGGNQGINNVHSDNGWSNAYDMGDTITFPSLSDPYPGYATYQAYLRANALVINDAPTLTTLANITRTTALNKSNANGSISFDGNGNMTVNGIVYIEGGNLKMSGNGTISYTGKGSILVTGNATIDTNLVTAGNNSYPANVLGIMTPGDISLGTTSQLDLMGLFYAEGKISLTKQTNLMGTIVSNWFDMSAQVPTIYQVPATANNLPPGMIAGNAGWSLSIVSWQKL